MAKKDNFMDGLKKHWDKLINLGQTCDCVTCRKHVEEKKEYMR